MVLIRLNKYLAEQNIASRRKADELIAKGLVKVNGKTVTELGVKVDLDKDKVELNNQVLTVERQKMVYLKINKPFGYECSKNPPRGVKSIYDLLPDSFNVFTVGRLDKDSEGLMLLTNDGRLAYRLTHPSFEKEKEYEVTVDKNVKEEQLAKLAAGVTILGRKTSETTVEPVSKRKFKIILKEGMNRQIRRMCRKVGLRVHKLKRFRIGEIELDGLQLGQYERLTGNDLSYVMRLLKEMPVVSNELED